MKNKTLICFFVVFNIIVNLTACSHKSKISSLDTINVDNGDDIPTLDPALSQDVASSRVLYNLFEGLTSFDQKNQIIPGLAESWNISADKKTYTFHLRPELKFSDGTPIQANDVVFTWQRLVAPSTASPYNFLANNIVNGQKIIDGKLNSQHLAVIALDPQTIQFKLNQPDDAFLEKCSLPNVGIISQANLQHEGNQHWGLPGKIAYSGAYQLTEYVVQGHVTLSKNLFYYDKKMLRLKISDFFQLQMQVTHTVNINQEILI